METLYHSKSQYAGSLLNKSRKISWQRGAELNRIPEGIPRIPLWLPAISGPLYGGRRRNLTVIPAKGYDRVQAGLANIARAFQNCGGR